MSANLETLPILIIGAGAAGPALALSLHQKGYKVILFEKYDGPSPGGASINFAANGLRVLDSIGLAEPLFTRNIAVPVQTVSFRTEKNIIVKSDIDYVQKTFGFPFAGMKRSVFLQFIIESVQERGIEIRFSHALTGIIQAEDHVTAIFDNGQSVKGTFLVGCDGLHSQTRKILFGPDVAEYTGLTQTAGLSLIPSRVRHLQNLYGDNVHLVSYAIGSRHLHDQNSGTHDNMTLISWAVTLAEAESRESWKADSTGKFRQNLIDHLNCEWEDGISTKELFDSAPELIKFGLYDRKELPTWHKGRVVLIGDAAHPTGPHLGQGASQALEDVSTLTSLLETHITSASSKTSPTTAELSTVFDALDELRIPRTTALVRGAREAGQQRVLPSDSTTAQNRNDYLSDYWRQSEEALVKKYERTLGPRIKS
ncbi:hypothetical protein BU17DRAFT_94619 [Hysterangium stoloniferum]|nr:hypothetical protein BU17DRAFT_94619 [Hysterangium stoloniferum]